MKLTYSGEEYFDDLIGQNNKFINKLIGSFEESGYRTTSYYCEETASVREFVFIGNFFNFKDG
ncbi:hypothetical protein [Polaribacter sp. Q13]|uniref:hypothetical protein n=1 Tax=Polaribacter sp. Q13 TaxID=2806551 RepID=UPI00193C5079|nr:hypothetical protein [Polaribacter sp. Q13]QVY65841.1 hypothetical protein JOP69_00685 [Polaribacter sp. Q13]